MEYNLAVEDFESIEYPMLQGKQLAKFLRKLNSLMISLKEKPTWIMAAPQYMPSLSLIA